MVGSPSIEYDIIEIIKLTLERKPPFSTTFPTPFQLVEINNFGWKILFATENHGNSQVENDILIENVSHVLTPHQLPISNHFNW